MNSQETVQLETSIIVHTPHLLEEDEVAAYLQTPEEFSAVELQMLKFFQSFAQDSNKWPNEVIISYLRKYLQQTSEEEDSSSIKKKQKTKSLSIRKTAFQLLDELKSLEDPKPSVNEQVDKLNSQLKHQNIVSTQVEALAKRVQTSDFDDDVKKIAELRMLTPSEVRSYLLLEKEKLSQAEIEFLVFLNEVNLDPDIFTPEKIVYEIEKYLKKTSSDTRAKDLSPQTTKIRKTALSLYKFTVIPKQKISQGSFKEARYPIGLDPQIRSEYIQAILKKIGPIWSWGGQLPKELPENDPEKKRNQEQWVRLSSSRKLLAEETYEYAQKYLEAPVVSPTISAELDALAALTTELGNPPYLPKLRRFNGKVKLEHSVYLPKSFESHTQEESLKTMSKLLDALEELWKKAGKINTDLKPENIKKTADGQPVLLDWGGVLSLHPGQETVEFPIKFPSTPDFRWPEEKYIYNDEYATVSVEKILVFDIGKLLLIDLYGVTNVTQALNKSKGFNMGWHNVISQETAAFMHITYKTRFNLDDELLQLLEKMVHENPEDRPTIAEVRAALNKRLQ